MSSPESTENGGATAGNDRVTRHETDAEKAYWADFYARADFDSGSSFSELVRSLPNIPGTIIDIGAGQGRDSLAFARGTDAYVVGIDRSLQGVQSAHHRAISDHLEGKLQFHECDVTDHDKITGIFQEARKESSTGNVLYYMRFFLHSIPEDAQEALLLTISQDAQAGDMFAAEFRTDKDEFSSHEFGDSHYRRYQNAAQFSQNLKEKYGWSNLVLEVESTGLSPYKHEDPVLYRVVVVR